MAAPKTSSKSDGLTASVAVPAPAPALEPKGGEMVRIYVHGEGALTHTHEGVTYHARGGSFTKVPLALAEKWKDMFPDRLRDAEDAIREVGGAQAALNAKQAELDAALAEVAALKAKLT